MGRSIKGFSWTGLCRVCVIAAPAAAWSQTFVDRTALVPGLVNAPTAWGDVNNDGWSDMFCAGSVFINRLGQSFTRVSVPGTGSGLIVDLDNDGRGDVVSYSPLAIFRNTADGPDGLPIFREVSLPASPPPPPTVCLSAAASDLNGDGFVDLYIAGYEDWERQITHPSFVLESSRGEGFVVRSISSLRRSRGVTACDVDENGTQDLYVSNYRLQPNQLLIGDGKGGLLDEASRRGALATSPGFEGGHSIGASWGDFDNDGHFDLFAGNFAHVDSRGDQPKSRFLRNLGPHADAAKAWTFEDLHECGVWYQESYASPSAADFDNDGLLDLYLTTVYADASFGKKNFPVLYRNQSKTGEAWAFADATRGAGLEGLPATYQAAWADFNRDGSPDLVTGGKLFAGAAADTSSWLLVRLVGKEGRGRDAIGAQARIRIPGTGVITRQVECGTGQGNSNCPILHFGLGQATGILKVEVRWPDGTTTLAESTPGRYLEIVQTRDAHP